MTDPERKTMIAIAKSLSDLISEVKEIKRGTLIVPTSGVPVPAVDPLGKIEHKIEQNIAGRGFLKINAQFEGAEFLPYEERMAMTEHFLGQMQELLKSYRVTSMTGTFTKV